MQDLGLKLFEAELYRFYSSNFVLWPLQKPDYMRAFCSADNGGAAATSARIPEQ
jgi:hypothetical protein